MALTSDDVRDLAELLLEKRLGEHEGNLSRCQETIDRELRERNQTPGTMARGQLVTAWLGAYQQHCDQILTDLVGLMRSYAAAEAAGVIHSMLTQHLDEIESHLIRSLAESSFGGLSSAPSERRRITNTATGIKIGIQERWQDEIALLEREASRRSLHEASAADLDDRLPLSRRRVFDQDIEALTSEATPTEPLALVMLDIDHFKRVNDEHGHPVGDEVLLAVARLVVSRVAHKGRCYRYGGEELAVLLPTYSTEEAAGLAERLRKDLEATPMSSSNLRITASLGVASVPEQAAEPGQLLERADQALYAAKSGGRNKVCSAADD